MDRTQYIGGTDIAAIMGLNPWRSPLDVALEKLGQQEKESPGERAYWGNVLEDVVAIEYAKRNERKVERVNKPIIKGVLGGRLDRVVWPDMNTRAVAYGRDGQPLFNSDATVLEVKTVDGLAARHWNLTAKDPADRIPLQYYMQCMWYLGLCDMRHADLAVLIGGNTYWDTRLPRHDALIQEMQEFAMEWWERHIVHREPVPPRTREEVERIFPRSIKREVIATPDIETAVTEAAAIKSDIKSADEKLAALQDAIAVFMGENNALIDVTGKTLVTYTTAKDSQVVDWQALAKSLGATADDIAQFTATRVGSRRMLIK